jgi:hypothetical protein
MIGSTKPVLDRAGKTILYDMFIDGKWVGSRRTFEQAMAALAWVLWPSRRGASL